MLTSQGTLPWFPSHPIPSLSRNLIRSRIMQMLPPADNNPPKIKNSSNNNNNNSGGSAGMLRPPAEQGLKCPRCDSANTKFCYYNNYSLSQPRHFCKTCRRYWTRGGALRNVPVGGGCRKSKKSKSASSSAAAAGGSASSCSAAVSLSSSSSMGNFQLGMLPSGVFNGSNQFVGFNYPIAVASPVGVNHMASSAADDQIMFGFGGGGAHLHQHQSSSSIALSIESLSSMNQDLHWKLQQQRLAMLFEGGGDQNQHKPATPLLENHHQMVGPISFQVADEGAKGEICEPRKSDAGGGATAWFLEGSSTANYSNGRINGGSSSNNNNSTSDWNAIITWNDMPQFSALP